MTNNIEKERINQTVTTILHCPISYLYHWVGRHLEKDTNDSVLEVRQHIAKIMSGDLEIADKIIELVKPVVKERKERSIAIIKRALLSSGAVTEKELATVEIKRADDDDIYEPGCWVAIKNGKVEYLGYDSGDAFDYIWGRMELKKNRTNKVKPYGGLFIKE